MTGSRRFSRDTVTIMTASNPGTFILVIGPTGSGKSTLMKHVIEQFPELVLPYSYTTRTKRSDHVEGKHYTFITVEEFKQKIDAGEFLEWAEYGGNYYGTLRSEVEKELSEGKVLLKEVEVQGARQIRSLLPKKELMTVFVSSGDWPDLEARVRARAPITEEELTLRKQRYEDEITFKDEADQVILNTEGRKEAAKEDFKNLIQSVIQHNTHG